MCVLRRLTEGSDPYSNCHFTSYGTGAICRKEQEIALQIADPTPDLIVVGEGHHDELILGVYESET